MASSMLAKTLFAGSSFGLTVPSTKNMINLNYKTIRILVNNRLYPYMIEKGILKAEQGGF